jgi:molybdopterin/thiamine biosynthesis adenylyltransferase
VTEERYSRNEALFGAEGQSQIRETRVAIVGLGGLGAHVAQQSAYLGVEDFVLIDFDVLSESNLNRLVGAFEVDLLAAPLKIEIAKRMITAINPNARVALHDARLTEAKAQAAIASSDVVFGCVDRDRHRIELTEICSTAAESYSVTERNA